MSTIGAPAEIVVVTKNYPSGTGPHVGTFVQALAEQFSRAGVGVTVIAPQRVSPWTSSDVNMSASEDPDSRRLTVMRPRFWSFSNKVVAGRFSTFRWTSASFSRSVVRAARRIDHRPSLVYAHFLFPAGGASLKLSRRWGVPAAIALGEGSLPYYETHLDIQRIRETIHRFARIICVSQENKAYCVERMNVSEERITVLPNSADTTRFYPRDRDSMRTKHGLPAERPIIAFVGHFNENKGPLRVLEAIRTLPEVGAVFLGDGPQTPHGDQVLFAGRVPHSEIPEWLSAADLFVLPTVAEASPNAIVEALACGLPVVSSNIPSVTAMAGDGAATLVDPMDEQGLHKAIKGLLGSPERRREMSTKALERARSYTLQDRAERILRWLGGIARQDAGG